MGFRYVQHLISREAVAVRALLSKGGVVLVCGDAVHMAPAVRNAVAEVMGGGRQGEAYVSRMLEQGRYAQDVWG